MRAIVRRANVTTGGVTSTITAPMFTFRTFTFHITIGHIITAPMFMFRMFTFPITTAHITI